jgi:hypothetical protein
MSTDVVHDQTDQPIAHRFFGGVSRGTVVQMEITRDEWPDWAGEAVHEEGWSHSCTFAEWVSIQERMGVTFEWDSAARQNEMARRFEDHRWADSPTFQEAASRCRTRARAIARSTIRAVA